MKNVQFKQAEMFKYLDVYIEVDTFTRETFPSRIGKTKMA